jgi:hypothetical protein
MSEQTGLYHPVETFTNDQAARLYEKAQWQVGIVPNSQLIR